MFGSCAGKVGQGLEEEDDENSNSRRPKRYQGQKRDLIIKQVKPVPHQTLVADISEIEAQLSDEEREYEAKVAVRQEEQRRKEEELKETAIRNAVAGASGQLSGSLLDRMQNLAKLNEVVKSTMKLEFRQLTTSRKGGTKSTSTSGGSWTSAVDDLKMPMPEASAVVVKITHPCFVSALRAKLHHILEIPLDDIRIVHRNKALKDEGLVPDDSVDDGEQDKVQEVLDGGGLDLSYLWVVDASNLGESPHTRTSKTQGSSSRTAKKRANTTTDNSNDNHQVYPAEDEENGHGDWEEVEAARGRRSGSSGREEGSGWSSRDQDRRGETGGTVSEGGGHGERLFSPLALGFDGESPGGARDAASESAIGKKRACKKEKDGISAAASGGSDGDGREHEEQRAKRCMGRLVPGSLVLTSLSASDLPNTEKGVFSKQNPYIVVRWGGQEARTSVKRDPGKDCSWPKEELALIVRSKKQLREPVEIEVWNDNAGNKKPGPDVLIGKGSFPFRRLAPGAPAALVDTMDGKGGVDDGDRGKSNNNTNNENNNTDDEGCSEGLVLTVALLPGSGRARKNKNPESGAVTLTLAYTPPRRKPPKARRGDEAAVAAAKGKTTDGDHTATDSDKEDTLTSIAGLSALSSLYKRNHLSVQELGAAMSQALEGFDVREELSKIGCLRYAQGIIDQGFGQRGAFANVQEEHLVGHPMYVPCGARKRLLALAELTRLQMREEKKEVTTAIEAITKSSEGAFEAGYTIDGKTFFDTRAAMKQSIEEDRAKIELTTSNVAVKEEDLFPRPKSPKPRSAAKEKVIRAIEATAEAEERGIYRPTAKPDGSDRDEDRRPCCETHALQLKRSAERMLDERVKDTSSKVDLWLDRADRFKNGAIPREAVQTVIRDAHLLNGLPSPRESDVRATLQHTSIDDQEIHFDRGKLGLELEHLVRKELIFRLM